MVEVVTQQQQQHSRLLANGNIREEEDVQEEKMEHFIVKDHQPHQQQQPQQQPQPQQQHQYQHYQDDALLNSPTVMRFLKEEQESLSRELQFYDVVSHVLAKIEKETREAEEEEGEWKGEEEEYRELWPELSLLDMKLYLKPKVHSAGVSEHSTVFILEAVSTKLGRLLHGIDIYDIRQLAAATDAQLDELVKKAKTVMRGDVECAVQDAKAVMRIIGKEKARQKGASWNNWSNLADLNIKGNTQKLAKFVWQFNPKGIVDAIARTNNADEDDVDAFYSI